VKRSWRRVYKPAMIYLLLLGAVSASIAAYGSWRKSQVLADQTPEFRVYYFGGESSSESNSPSASPVAGAADYRGASGGS
jgi:hypothetical protein